MQNGFPAFPCISENNIMKKHITKLIGIALVAFYLLGCDDDNLQPQDPGQTGISVQFEKKQDEHLENGGDKLVKLTFSSRSTHPGTITLAFDSTLSKHFNSVPASQNGIILLPVAKGQDFTSFTLTPKNNSVIDGNRTVAFTAKNATPGYLIGEQNVLSLTIKDDEGDFQNGSYANFIPANASIREDHTEGYTLQVHLSEGPNVNGSVIIEAESTNAQAGINFRTVPALVDGKLTLPATPGTNVVSFNVLPLDNNVISGHLEITFKISSTTGNIKKGTTLTESFNITDDELEGMPKGYETSGGGWGMKRTYEYNTKGNIARVLWETQTPYLSTGIDTYYYNEADQLIRINTDPGHDIIYHWENGKIVKQEKVRDGVVRGYSEYGYDDQGNVGTYRTFYLQPDGTFSLSDITALLYFLDGNLYKKIVYYPTSDPVEEQIISETTFDHYINEENPFHMVEVLPNTKTQKNLPGSYRVKTNGQDLLYSLSYEFRLDGKVGKRTANRGNTSDITVYHYY